LKEKDFVVHYSEIHVLPDVVMELKRRETEEKKWSPMGKAHGSQETPARGEHPVPEDQFTHG